MGGAAEMMGRESRTLPGRNVAGVEAGRGAASAKIRQRRGGQKNHEREGEEAEREYAWHECIIPCQFAGYNKRHGQCDDFRAAGGPGLGQ